MTTIATPRLWLPSWTPLWFAKKRWRNAAGERIRFADGDNAGKRMYSETCCCHPPDYWAMGVDDIDAPTQTRIPRIATISFSGAYFNGAVSSCGNPDWLNDQVHQLVAYSPTYSSDYNGAAATEGGVIQMHWTSANPSDVLSHVWPGAAGKPATPAGTGRLPSRIFASEHPLGVFVDDAGPGWTNMLAHYYFYSSNPSTGFPLGYPEWASTFQRYNGSLGACIDAFVGSDFGDQPRMQYELSLVCGGEGMDAVDGNVRAYFSANLISYGASAPTRPATTKACKELDVPFVGYSFTDPDAPGGDRTQRICVIPESITFGPSCLTTGTGAETTSPYDGDEGNALGHDVWVFDDMTIQVEFSSWYTGPTVEG